MHNQWCNVQEMVLFYIKYLQVSFYFCSFALDFFN